MADLIRPCNWKSKSRQLWRVNYDCYDRKKMVNASWQTAIPPELVLGSVALSSK